MHIIIFRYIVRFGLLIFLFYIRKQVEINKVVLGDSYNFFHPIVEFLLLLTFLNILTAILIMIYRLRKNIPYKFTDNVIIGINNLYYLIVFFGVIAMILGFWGKDFKSLLTSLSIVAAAIAIISKDYVSEIISGFIISFSKALNIDDYVKIGENKGKILDISLNKTVLLNDDDDIIFIPNDKVYMSEIINYTKKDIRKVNLDFELSLEHHTTIEELEDKLCQNIQDLMEHIEKDSVQVKVVKVYHDHLALKFQYQLKEVNREIENLIRKKTVRYIANAIKR